MSNDPFWSLLKTAGKRCSDEHRLYYPCSRCMHFELDAELSRARAEGAREERERLEGIIAAEKTVWIQGRLLSRLRVLEIIRPLERAARAARGTK